MALCFSILVEAMKRMVIPEGIENTRLVLVVGSVGLVVNVIGLFLFHQHGHSHGGGSHGHSHGGHSHTVSPTATPRENTKTVATQKVEVPLLTENEYELDQDQTDGG